MHSLLALPVWIALLAMTAAVTPLPHSRCCSG